MLCQTRALQSQLIAGDSHEYGELEEKAKKINADQSSIQKLFEQPDSVFKLLKAYCFGGEKEYAQLPELTLTKEKGKAINTKVAEDGTLMLDSSHLTARVMRGYNSIYKIYFVAIKGLILENKDLREGVQIFCQISDKKSLWCSNPNSHVLMDENVLDFFMGNQKTSRSISEYFLI